MFPNEIEIVDNYKETVRMRKVGQQNEYSLMTVLTCTGSVTIRASSLVVWFLVVGRSKTNRTRTGLNFLFSGLYG